MLVVLSGCASTAGSPPPTAAASPSPAIDAPPQSSRQRGLPGAVPAGRTPEVVNHGPRTSNRVALTFDADMTDRMLHNRKSFANEKILDILQDRSVPATFFVTGLWAKRYPSLTQRIADDPRFEIANHTYRHSAYTPNCYTLPQLPRTEMTDDARRTFDTLEPFGGNQTRYFRFPGLCHDKAALTALAPLGVTVVDGDVVSGDPFATAAAPIVHAVLSQVKPGSIVILHVTESNAPYTDEALIPILDGLAKKGLEPVKLSDLLR